MEITITGTTPLLMHNIRLADTEDPYVKEINKLTAKKGNKRTDDDNHNINRLSFAGGLYHDEELGPYIPAENVFRCLQQAASLTRDGKKIERGLIFTGTQFPLQYDGPRDIDSLWGGGESRWVDRRMVAVQRTRIPRVRPIFPEWALQVEVEIDRQVLNEDEMADIAVRAGRMIGIGDFRRFYGRFQSKVS